MSSAIRLSPQLFEPCRVRGSVLDGVLNVPVSKKILNESRVGSLVGQSKAASVAEHVRMGNEGQGSGQAVRFQKQIDRRSMQRPALLADKETLAGWFHPGAFFQPCADGAELVGS
jgi:hypothetical protein